MPPAEFFASDPSDSFVGITDDATLPIGSTLGNYTVRGLIGQGAMGAVYRAEHTLLKKRVALKVLARSLVSNVDARRRFLREAEVAAAIKHPNVVDVTDMGLARGRPYFVMELLEGEDLDHYLEHRGALDQSELAAILVPLVAALAAAHDKGVIHRDLKPGNIFLADGADGKVVPKLLDFGVSKFASFVANGDFAATPFDQLMGSPLYLSPEAVNGVQRLSARSDQYSLGVVLYECSTGKTPFPRRSPLLPLLNAIAEGHFDPPSRVKPDISPRLEEVILRAMSRDANARFPHIRELGAAILEFADESTRILWGPAFARDGVAAAPPPPLPAEAVVTSVSTPAPASPRRRRSLRVVGLACVAIGALWLALGQAGARSQPPVRLSSEQHALLARGAGPAIAPAAPSEPGGEVVSNAPNVPPPPVVERAPMVEQAPAADPAPAAAAPEAKAADKHRAKRKAKKADASSGEQRATAQKRAKSTRARASKQHSRPSEAVLFD
jgi:eukaryotic-like serine/threonine-protein kinase